MSITIFDHVTGDGGNLVVQVDTIFVSGMNPEINEDDIEQHFGAIGIIKVKYFLVILLSISTVV